MHSRSRSGLCARSSGYTDAVTVRSCPGARVVGILAILGCLSLTPAAAFCQPQQSIGPYAIDLRGVFARHKQEPSVATDLSVTPGNLPTRSFGLLGGAHVYPLYTG